jgi:hypothetical protein
MGLLATNDLATTQLIMWCGIVWQNLVMQQAME